MNTPPERISYPLISDPAELVYQAYGAAKSWSDGPRGSLKLWHELSVHDRRAWQAAFFAIRNLLTGGQMVPVGIPSNSQITLVAFRDGAYVWQHFPRSLVQDSDAIGPALSDTILPELDAALDKLHAERDAKVSGRHEAH